MEIDIRFYIDRTAIFFSMLHTCLHILHSSKMHNWSNLIKGEGEEVHFLEERQMGELDSTQVMDEGI